MTRFEDVGISRLLDSSSRREAKRSFERSCRKCSESGRRTLCDSCPIRCTYENMETVFAALRMPVSVSYTA